MSVQTSNHQVHSKCRTAGTDTSDRERRGLTRRGASLNNAGPLRGSDRARRDNDHRTHLVRLLLTRASFFSIRATACAGYIITAPREDGASVEEAELMGVFLRRGAASPALYFGFQRHWTVEVTFSSAWREKRDCCCHFQCDLATHYLQFFASSKKWTKNH